MNITMRAIKSEPFPKRKNGRLLGYTRHFVTRKALGKVHAFNIHCRRSSRRVEIFSAHDGLSRQFLLALLQTV